MTALYGVIGDPIAQSLSPLIHSGWIRDFNLNAEYLAMQVPAGAFKESLETLARRGARGVNVTMPHKAAAAEVADFPSLTVQTLGAANTLVRMDDGSWLADNTDVPGFRADLATHDPAPVAGRTVFVLGAGGAARAVVLTLAEDGASIVLCNRTRARADALMADLALAGHAVLDLEAGLARLGEADLVINTAGLGHEGASLDLPPGQDRLFYDISYGKAAETVTGPARDAGWRTADGLGMLVGQAARSFETWFGETPDEALALKRCRRALEMAG